ncbi:MAG: hypothetical protein R3C02_05610 [Planctomycetaceae bacterium]
MPLQIYLAEKEVTIETDSTTSTPCSKTRPLHGRGDEGLNITGLEIPEEFIVRDSFGHPTFSSKRKITVARCSRTHSTTVDSP